MPLRFPSSRWSALAVVAAVLAVSTVAYGFTVVASGDEAAVATTTTTTTTTRPTTTTTEATTTTTTAPTTTTVPVDDGVLERGEKGEAVAALQRRLAELRFDPGPADGSFGSGTLYAVQGFQQLVGMAPDGKVGPAVQEALANPPAVAPLVPDGEPTRVEVDKSRQLLFLYQDGNLRLITHVSTGSGEEYCSRGRCGRKAITPEGAFRFMWRYDGWRESELGKLYNPVYFTGSGIAVHGSSSVPAYPASHGCVRIPMHIAEYFPSLVKRGDAVYVLSGPGASVGQPPSGEPTGPPPSDPPTSPDTTTTTAPREESTTTTTTPSEPTTTTVPLP
jgi:peptidoglycan hydrolase-like protein with peptidoglycan-binding domain